MSMMTPRRACSSAAENDPEASAERDVDSTTYLASSQSVIIAACRCPSAFQSRSKSFQYAGSIPFQVMVDSLSIIDQSSLAA